MLLGMVLAGKAGLDPQEDPNIGWVTPVPPEIYRVTQGYLEWLLCFKGENVINLFLPPVVGEKRVADDSGAGEARVEVESDLVSRITEQINFKPKRARERSGGEPWSKAAGSREPAELQVVCPYMLVLELVSPLTTMLQPGHIPSGYSASNCQRRGEGEVWQDGRGECSHSSFTCLHLPHPLIIFSLLPAPHAPAFFSLLNKFRGLHYSVFLWFYFILTP